jgi:hypothetical protein
MIFGCLVNKKMFEKDGCLLSNLENWQCVKTVAVIPIIDFKLSVLAPLI